jgi:enoyl-CoA hydratase/carnithine racemase
MSKIETSLNDGVFHIEFTRPEAKNPMDNEFFQEMRKALTKAEENPEARVVLISGRGEGFCSGADLKALRKDRGVLTGDSVSWPGNLMALKMALMTKPIVAAVHGVAFGGGVTMLLYCDFVVAAEGTKFCTPFSKLGLCTELGSSLLLPLAVGMRKAKEWALLGDVFDASEAHEAGFVNTVVPREELMERAGKYISKLKDACPSSLRAIKRLMIEAHLGVLGQTLIKEYESLDKGLKSPEFTEALEAFAEKRKPDFSLFS